ncbi:hypothetical protein GE09DRAFT_1225120 [Coniochaeta sp. 2T2.1]|nr:hypothetical protein GE09DRAFT_1225120 [Coniochaeta sp. 2T2.1]
MDRSAEMKHYPSDDHTAQKPADQGTEHTDENTTANDETTIDAQIRLKTPSMPKPSPFGTLPAELLGSIMEYLPHQSRAALALVDRTTVFLGGSYLVSQKSCGEDRLEPNLVHVMRVRDKCSTPKCRRCLALRSMTRPCPSRERMDLASLKGPLPPFGIAREIMTAFRCGAHPAPLLARYDISLFTGFHECETGVKPTFNTAILRVFRGPGKLALKAETALWPHQVRDMVMDQLLPRICAHRSWEDKYPFLCFNKRSSPCSAGCRTAMSLHFAFWD